MRKRNIIALSIFVIFYISFGVFLTLKQESVVYHPFPQDFDSCSDFSSAEKIEHHDTRMYVKDSTKPTIVLYHGNAGSACDRYFYANLFSQAGYGYIVVEYAGYSNDTKDPTHNLLKQDVENVISYIKENGIDSPIIVGESIGTGLASYHTSPAPPARLLLISPFTDLADVASNRFWFYPTSLLVDNAFDNVSNLKNYSGETTIIHGAEDSIIPYKLGSKLHQSLSGNSQLITIEAAGHNDLFTKPSTYEALNNFLSNE